MLNSTQCFWDLPTLIPYNSINFNPLLICYFIHISQFIVLDFCRYPFFFHFHAHIMKINLLNIYEFSMSLLNFNNLWWLELYNTYFYSSSYPWKEVFDQASVGTLQNVGWKKTQEGIRSNSFSPSSFPDDVSFLPLTFFCILLIA